MKRKEAIKDGVYGLMADDTLKVWNEIENLDDVKYIVVKNGFTCVKMLRDEIEGEYNFDDAQKKAAEIGVGWRCPARHEWIDIYDMRFNGLDEFRERLGMSKIDGWYWSCEEDTDPQYSAQYAWNLYYTGYVHDYIKRYGYRVCAVSAFQIYSFNPSRFTQVIMDKDNSYEIPFGAKDSELKGWEYTIPEGMEAEIKDGKIIVREKESEDERIRKALIQHIKYNVSVISGWRKEELITWLEKQGEHKPAWSEEDEIGCCDAMWAIEQARTIAKDENDMGNLWYAERWLKSLKERYAWKPSDEHTSTDAFIEKACEWLKDNIYHRVYECGDRLGFPTAKFIEDFKNYMKGE